MTPNSVVIVNSYGSVNGGATRVAIDEAVGLADRGISVIYFSSVGPVSEELRSRNIRVISLEQRDLISGDRSLTVAFQGLWNVNAYDAMSDVLKSLSPNETVIHVHGVSHALSASPIRCALRRNFKVVSSLHDYFFACPNGAFFDFRECKECSLRAMSLSCVTRNCDKRSYSHKLYRLLKTDVQRRVCGVPGDLKYFIALSSQSIKKISPYLPRNSKIYSLPNPSLVSKRPPVDLLQNREIVAIGRLDPEKGIELLVEAGQIANLRILFIGDGPLRRVAEAAGLNEVTGWLPRAELLNRLETARCVVFPSLWPETFGLTVMDAAARGIPSIVSDITGIAERVEHGVTGLHVQAGNREQLAASLRATQDADTMAAFGGAAYARFWQSPLTQNNHVDHLLEIYGDMLTDRSLSSIVGRHITDRAHIRR